MIGKNVLMRYLKLLVSLRFSTAVSLLICGTILLSLGPAFQQHSTSLISSPSAGIYQSVYKDSLIAFAPFKAWISGAISVDYLCGSALLLFCLKMSKTYRGAALLVMLTAFLINMAIDLHAYFTLPPNSIALFECLISNIVGGIIFAFVYVSISYICQTLPKVATEHSRVAQLFSSIGPAILAVAVLLIQYYVLALFFSPITSYVEAKVASDATLGIIYDETVKKRLAEEEAERCHCEKNKEDKNNFNFLSGDFEGNLSITGQGKDSSIVWSSESGKKAKVTLSAYDGCYFSEAGKFPKADKRALIFDDVESLEIKLPSSMVTVKAPIKQGSLEFNKAIYSSMWLEKKDNAFTITRFAGENQIADYWVHNKDINLELNVPLLDLSQKSKATPELKIITIVQNGKSTQLKLMPPSNMLGVKGCYAVPIKNRDVDLMYVDALTNIMSLRLMIKPMRSSTELYYDKRNYVTFKGVSGWYSVSNIAEGGTNKLASPGVVQGLSVFKGLKHLSLNGKPVEDLENRMFTFYNSDISLDLNDDDALVLKGESKLVWVDKKRLSPTRWENMDGATQGILLGLAGTLLLGFLVLLRNLWKANPSLAF
jgi:hypothetical protein